MRSPLLLVFVGAAALLGGGGCINTDPTIFVDPSAESPAVSVEKKSVLETQLTGGFTLKLHLGARASGPAEVNLQGFALQNEDQSVTFVESVPLSASGQELPITVEPDTDESIVLAIDPQPLSAEEVTALCGAGEVIFSGSITDSLRGGAAPVKTDPVSVTGCM